MRGQNRLFYVPSIFHSLRAQLHAVQNTNNRDCIDLLLLHFWVGSFCDVLNNNNNKPAFPRRVSAISDIKMLIEDMGNQILDKSYPLSA
jgi:hypothetical protein